MREVERQPVAFYGPAAPPDLTALLRRPQWHHDALCREYPTLTWFPALGARSDEQRAICARCPVRAECLEAGLDEPDGLWGGMPPRERRKLRNAA